MSKFNVGDRVRCIIQDNYGDLRNGNIYTVAKFNEHWVHLENQIGGWLPYRFELVDPYVEQDVPQPQPDSLVPAFNAVHDAIQPLSSLDRRKVIHAVKVLLDIQ